MARCYSGWVKRRHPSLPRLWLVSDARNDAGLEAALARLPRGSGLVFRHYHLSPEARRARFERLARKGRAKGHWLVLSASPREARRWGADGAYGDARFLARGPAVLRLVTAHSAGEVARAHRARADAILLSPVHATRSHTLAKPLGPLRFRLLTRHARVPVIALGGMTAARARHLPGFAWAAIDGLAKPGRRLA